MVKAIRQLVLTALVLALAGAGLQAQAQYNRANQRTVRQLITRIEQRAFTFNQSVDAALDRSRIDGTRREDNINQLVRDFQDSVDRMETRFNQRQAVAADVQEVLNRANWINDFMLRTRLSGRAQTDWAALRTDLSELARIYNVTWNWSTTPTTTPTTTYPSGGGYQGGRYGANRLTGTFRLDTTRSDDSRNAAANATRGLPSRNRQRVLDNLTARLESPDQIAIDRRGRTITIASTRAPQITFEADGREAIETTPNGRQVRVRATLVGDQLSVSTTGNRDNDFTVTFDPIEGGRRLRVTRRISNANLTTPVVVNSIYDRTDDVARLDIYNGSTYPNNNTTYPDNTTASGDFIVTNGTMLIATLNENLSTSTTRENDRFTMTVREPSQYDGATIEGYVSNVSRGGRITGRSEMSLNYERIRLRDGRSYRFSGLTETIRTANGETVRIDNEGSVEGGNQTSRTTQRAAIGTAVGAIIGAIAGGGKGAAIGAVIGAGAGAGSVYVQGRDNLELMSGTEVSIRSTGPR
ncbi:MAG TPA: YMGG-like glycine zipper-containing protein [Pyrinomonadaceae bacterium]|nr:YMGG-like glycine zipper-containing protein [Pyrinomonadaceae bacterium]